MIKKTISFDTPTSAYLSPSILFQQIDTKDENVDDIDIDIDVFSTPESPPTKSVSCQKEQSSKKQSDQKTLKMLQQIN